MLHLTGTADSFREIWSDEKFYTFYLFGPMLFQSGEQLVVQELLNKKNKGLYIP
jgi:hypothetical protein